MFSNEKKQAATAVEIAAIEAYIWVELMLFNGIDHKDVC